MQRCSVNLMSRLRSAVPVVLVLMYGLYVFILVYENGPAKECSDTQSYFTLSSFSLFSKDFWFGPRAPFVPLIYKALAQDPSRIVFCQTVLSIVAWSLLAVLVFSLSQTTLAGILAMLLIFFYSLTDNIVLWNHVLLSESLNLSIVVAMISVWILYLRRQTIFTTFLVISIGFAFVFVRDTNAYVAIGIAGMLIVFEIFRRVVSQRPVHKSFLLVAILYCLLFAASTFSQDMGKRWVFPFYNVLSQRILPYPHRLAFFRAHGMPVNEVLLGLSGKWASSDDWRFIKDQGLSQFRSWTEKRGKQVYMLFLVSHPIYLMEAPMNDLGQMITMNIIKFKVFTPTEFTSSLPGILWQYLVGVWGSPIILFVCGFVFGAVFVSPHYHRHSYIYTVALANLFLVIPHYLVAYHGDAMEIYRHSLTSVVQFHLSCILGFITILDIHCAAIPLRAVFSIGRERPTGRTRQAQ